MYKFVIGCNLHKKNTFKINSFDYSFKTKTTATYKKITDKHSLSPFVVS